MIQPQIHQPQMNPTQVIQPHLPIPKNIGRLHCPVQLCPEEATGIKAIQRFLTT